MEVLSILMMPTVQQISKRLLINACMQIKKLTMHSGEKHQGRSEGVDFSLKTVIINDD